MALSRVEPTRMASYRTCAVEAYPLKLREHGHEERGGCASRPEGSEASECTERRRV